jgi:hypothetical protein
MPTFFRTCPSNVRYDHGGVRNNVGAIVDKAVEIVALPHIAEEIFLRPNMAGANCAPELR